MKFEIMDSTSKFKDLGLLKNDMTKAEGHWVGYLMDP
jgi:hypothetical protein